jgi:hypothetical protein
MNEMKFSREGPSELHRKELTVSLRTSNCGGRCRDGHLSKKTAHVRSIS